MSASIEPDAALASRRYADEFARHGSVELVRPTKLQALAAERLQETWRTVPHVTHSHLVDVTDLETARVHWNRGGRDRLTLLPFLIKALVAALEAYPSFNASRLPNGEVIRKSYFHIGVVVDVGEGLMIPVLRDCDRKTVLKIAVELNELAIKARTKGLAFGEMSGGCFTISSLGGVAGTGFTPIINAPEAAILGVSRAVLTPVCHEGAVKPRIVLPLSLTYDHRLNNGAEAGRFIGHLGHALCSMQADSIES
jgi:pyruvate dehydrogenase E2 component (dihydrolipoamide acetyltransferase)